MLRKFFLFNLSIILSLSLTGCTSCASKSISSEAVATPKGSKSLYKKSEPTQGLDNFLSSLGMAIVFGTIFKSAPKEAYK
jgi:uncharacterized protein YceK